MALLLVTRYANRAMVLGVLAVFAVMRLRRAASWMAVTALVTGAVLLAIPVVRHIPYAAPPNIYTAAKPLEDSPSVLVRPARRRHSARRRSSTPF